MRTVMPYVVGLVVLMLVLVWIGGWAPAPDLATVEVRIESVAPDAAVIVWRAEVSGPGRIEYGPSDRLGSVIEVPESAAEHRVRLDGLEPATRYYFKVSVGEAVSRIHSFTTHPAPPSFHVEPYLQLPAPDAMTIMWETTERLPGRVEYGTTEKLGQVVEEPGRARLHQVRLTGLQPATTYHYRVVSGNVISPIYQFRTAPPHGTKTWRMALYGDSRSNPAIHRKVVEQIAKYDVDLIVHTGDIVANGKNYASWRREWFVPLAPLARSVPWVSTIGNHEADAENYFSYVALPGNERFYSFQFGNARFICLDSNGWIEKGRDSKQYQWLLERLQEAPPLGADWTFVVFHHPLFSGHKTRPINPLRWDWAPLFVDPLHNVDAVLNGHDHFYCRTYPIGRITNPPWQGVVFLTSAGGGAPLYPIRERDYVAAIRSVHHFTLFEFTPGGVSIYAIDINGTPFDGWGLVKGPTKPDLLCAYEVEEIKEYLRKALVNLPPTVVQGPAMHRIKTALEVPTDFQVPIKGWLRFQKTDGWFFPDSNIPFELEPLQALRIPLEAVVVETQGLTRTPLLTIEFAPGRFRNTTIELFPFKLTGPAVVTARRSPRPKVDGIPDEAAWQSAEPLALLPTTPGKEPSPGGQVRLVTDGSTLFVAAVLDDPDKKVRVSPPSSEKEPSRLVLNGEHFRIEIFDGKNRWTFALSPENITYQARDGTQLQRPWQARAASGDSVWTAELAIPLDLFSEAGRLRINAGRKAATAGRECELRPSYELCTSPDLIPDWKSGSKTEHFAVLRLADGSSP